MVSPQSADLGLLSAFMKQDEQGTHFNLKRMLASAIVLYVLFNALRTLVTAFTSPLRHIPGPFWSRFTNLPLKKAVVGGRRIFFIDDLHKQYGEVVRISPDEVSVSDMDGFKKIHAISATFNKSKWYEKLTIFPRHSVFTMMTKETHAARRKLFARGFSKSYLREHYEPILAEKAKLAVEGIKKRALNGNADLMQWWTFLATDTVGRLGFGESFGMLEKGEKTDYIRTLELALIGNGIGAELPFVRSIGRWIPAKGAKLAFDATDIILDYGQKAVDNAKRQASETNLMANVLKEGEKESSQLDDLDVRVEATSLIFAGSGTTANTLTYLIWTVLKRPDLRKRIEDELDTLSPDYQDKDLESLPLLNAVLQETLRLYAAVPGSLPRLVPKSGLSVGGYFIPEGVTVGTQAYTMHRKESIWGRDALVFRPERWLKEEEGELSSEAKTAFCAFGAGAYTCLGIHIAYAEMRYAAAGFFRECRGVRLAEGCTDEGMEMENYFVITPKGHKCEVTMK